MFNVLLNVGFSWGLHQHKTLWHHADFMSIVVLNYEQNILAASKISQNIWELVLERIPQNLMTCTDIPNLSSLFFLFSFKSIHSSLEEVCSRMGKNPANSFHYVLEPCFQLREFWSCSLLYLRPDQHLQVPKWFLRSRFTWEVRWGFKHCCTHCKGMG